jgi:7,8-dihydropterin-6-yl-methyl-4-(beta-D-ribofuranosyl)aminobenzene 5'-phosphate synthase
MPETALALQSHFIFQAQPHLLLPGVTLSGEIPLRMPTGCADPGHFLIENDRLEIDTFADEQCLVLKKGDSVAILLGCSHRGVENNLLAAMEIAGTSRLDLVVGGMHLGGTDDARLQALVSFLQDQDLGQVVCCHCTGDRAFRYLFTHLGDRVSQGRTGSWWEL